MPLQTGKILNNRYRIVKLLGQGGMGAVYRAWDLNLQKPCAVKENLDTSAGAQAQFQREAKILSNLNHPNLVRVTDYFSLPGQGQYLVMDFAEGDDLQSILDVSAGVGQTQPYLSELQVLPWIKQVCDALTYIHSQNPPVIHRDIKPANIRINPQSQAILVDFGISKIYDQNQSTTMGARAVTPGYSPPEQYGRGRTDLRSDIYALGATLYTLLTGQAPLESIQRYSTPITSPRTLNPKISLQAEATVTKAMEIDPSRRFQSVAEFISAIKSPEPYIMPASPMPKGSKSWRWAGLTASIVMFILVGFLLGREFFTPSHAEQPITATSTQINPSESPVLLTDTPTQDIDTPIPTVTELPPPTDTISLPPTNSLPPPLTPTPPLNIVNSILGYSAGGREINMIQLGNSTAQIILVVGSWDGTQTDTTQAARELVDYYNSDPGRLLSNSTLYFVPSINPDGNANKNRYNQNGVDLNRNWDTANWRYDPPVPGTTDGKPGAGGSYPFSEPETIALRDLMLNLLSTHSRLFLVVLHSTRQHSNGQVFAGYTQSGFEDTSVLLANRVASILGYTYSTEWDYGTPGEIINWSADHGIPSVDLVWPWQKPPPLDLFSQALASLLQ